MTPESPLIHSPATDLVDEKPQYLVIADEIKHDILTGKFKIGDKLPPERDMAKYFDVGRPTIREAVRSLEIYGILETKRGNGTFVTNRTQSVMSSHLQVIASLNNVSIQEIIEYREMIETKAVSLAAIHRKDDELPVLYKCIEKLKLAKTYDEVREADYCFHMNTALMAHNALIADNYVAMSHFFEESINNSATEISNFGESYFDVAQYHMPIYDAISDRDPEIARLFMKRHMERIWLFYDARFLTKKDPTNKKTRGHSL